MKSVLLHICCGVCASYPVLRLQSEGYRVLGFFYNPNIQPQEEYTRRLAVALKVACTLTYELLTGAYEPEKWFQAVKGLEHEPEGATRCSVCFKVRMEEAHRKARQLGIPYFATTLSISPHKQSREINALGSLIDPAGFLEYDFKKQDGFKKATAFAKTHSLYRQNYCGCIFSRNQP